MLLQTLPDIWRRARREPAFVIATVVSLALGMSMAAALYSIVAALFTVPVGVNAPNLIQIEARGATPGAETRLRANQVAAVRADGSLFESVAAYLAYSPLTLVGPSGSAVPAAATKVTTNFFTTLGARPERGRVFGSQDEDASVEPIVLSNEMWRAQFDSDAGVVGRRVTLNGKPAEVVGVMPPGFAYPEWARMWLPLSNVTIAREATNAGGDEWPAYEALGRPRTDAPLPTINAQLDLIGRRNAVSGTPRVGLNGEQFTARIARAHREQIQLWVAVALVILVLSAVNFATASLARAISRRGEVAIWSALGATPSQTVVGLMTEPFVIAGVAGILATILAVGLLRVSGAWFPDASVSLERIRPWHTVVAGFGLTTLLGIVCTLPPAVEAAKTNLAAMLQRSSISTTTSPRELLGRKALVALQVALATGSVAVAAALAGASAKLTPPGAGYDAQRILTADLTAFDSSMFSARSTSLERVFDGIPEVEGIGVYSDPNQGGHVRMRAEPRGRWETLEWGNVSGRYFKTLGVTPLAGRVPTELEVSQQAPVTVLSSFVAQQLFGDLAKAIGKRVSIKGKQMTTSYVVIGIVPDLRRGPKFDPYDPPAYTFEERPLNYQTKLFFSVRGEQSKAITVLRSASAAAFGPTVILSNLRPVASDEERTQRASRRQTAFLWATAGFALLLAIVGVHSLMSYTTQLRIREFGIRLALGAQPADIVIAGLADIVGMVAAGAVIGLLISGRVAAILDSLYRAPAVRTPLVALQVIPTSASLCALVLVASIGSFLPLRRVLRADPMALLRDQ